MILNWFRRRPKDVWRASAPPKESEFEIAERERISAMEREKEEIQIELGFLPWDHAQSWLRLHQLLKSHEDRIAALERPKPRVRRIKG
jgi:hypothetical protein